MYEVRTRITNVVVFEGTQQECAEYLREAIGTVLSPEDFRILKAEEVSIDV